MVKSEIVSYLIAISYRLFGKITSRFTFKAFEQIYWKSNISRFYESYLTLMLFVSSIAFVLAFAAGGLLHHFLFNLTLFQYVITVLIFSSITSLIVLIMFIIYPLYRQSQRGKEIDANLVYTVGYMGVLAAGGVSIERLFERVTQIEQHPPIRDLAKRLSMNIKMFGLDVTSALMDLTLRSPSEAFSKLLIGISNTGKTSGDLRGLLTFETKRLLFAKRGQLKQTLGALMSLGEIYITAMVVGPILFIVMLTILSVMGNVIGPSPAVQLNLLVFIGLPMISTIFIVILKSIIPEEE